VSYKDYWQEIFVNCSRWRRDV